MNERTNGAGVGRRTLILGAVATGALATGALAARPAAAAEMKGNMGEGMAGLGLFAGINRAKNPAMMNELEKLHVPHFTAPSHASKGETVSVSVRVGETYHPMTMGHWIERLRLFDDHHMPIADIGFVRTGTEPGCDVRIRVDQTTVLIAQAFCNLHGIWEARHTITV